MATVDPKQTVIGLINLQKLDADVWRVNRRIAEGPLLLARRGERMRQAEAKAQQTQQKILDFKKQIGALELEVKSKEVEIAKIQGAQGQSRTNEEFRAFGEHIGRLRKENRAVEDRILEFYQQIETADATLKEQKSTVDSLKKESEEDAALWKRDEAEYRAELATFQARRDQFAKTLPPGPLSTYERMLRLRDGKAVVPSEGKSCGGCQMAITPNDFARLRLGNELVYCRSCERILYYPELFQQTAS
jgi:predicted  nucleic acid-binding Zn-ribbon protein